MSTGSEILHLPAKKFAFSPTFLPYKLAKTKYNKHVSGIVIKSIDVMTVNIVMITRILDFVWTSYVGLHMLTRSQPENSYPKFSHIVRWLFNKSKQFLGKYACPVTLVY